MSTWWNALGSIAVVTGVPLLLVVAWASSGRQLSRWLAPMVAFGAGALIGAAVFHLLPEAYHRRPQVAVVAAFAAAGGVFAFLLERWMHRWQHTEHDAPAPETAIGAFDDRSMVALNFLADSLHNFVDGALIAAAFIGGVGPGLATSAAMLAHELPRELGTFSIFLHYGARPGRAVALSAVSGALALLGGALTLVLDGATARVAEVLVPLAGGAFLFIGGSVMRSLQRARRAQPRSFEPALAFGAGLAISALGALIS
jgi:zinc and cadmium transporter